MSTPFVDPTWDAVDTYYASLFVEQDPILEATLKASQEAGLPPHNVSPVQAKFLQLLIQLKGAKRILEIGTLGGYSSIWFARSGPDYKVVTLEVDEVCAKIAQNNITLAGVQDQVEIKLGRALDGLDAMILNDKVEPFDFEELDLEIDIPYSRRTVVHKVYLSSCQLKKCNLSFDGQEQGYHTHCTIRMEGISKSFIVVNSRKTSIPMDRGYKRERIREYVEITCGDIKQLKMFDFSIKKIENRIIIDV